MKINFEIIAKQIGIPILQINENNIVSAKGIWIPEAVISFCDNNTSTISYPDTGIFILFANSYASSLEDKYKPYIDSDRKQTEKLFFKAKMLRLNLFWATRAEQIIGNDRNNIKINYN